MWDPDVYLAFRVIATARSTSWCHGWVSSGRAAWSTWGAGPAT